MFTTAAFVICFFVTLSTSSASLNNQAKMENLSKDKVVPDVIDIAPTGIIEVKYDSGVEVNFGAELTPTQVKDLPSCKFQAQSDKLYTLAMVDPDAPSRSDPKMREILHYLVVNIPGSEVGKGDTLAAYIGAGAPQGTGLHRYIFLAYEQKAKVLSDMKTPNNSREGRVKFSMRKFAEANQLGEPIAANFFQAQYDDYVPKLHAQLSGASSD